MHMPRTAKSEPVAATTPLIPRIPDAREWAERGSRVWTLAKKELYSYFYSPIAYVVMVIYLVFAGWFFFSRFFLFGELELRAFFEMSPLLFMFLAPAVTMRLLSEEINTGSYEMLMTLPVSEAEILLGKLLAAFCFLGVLLAVTLFYPLTLSTLGHLDWGPVISGYLGLLLLGLAYLSIGLLASALTRNQIVAFILSFAISFFLFLSDKFLPFLPGPLVGLFEYLGVEYHFQGFIRGVIDSKDVVYFATLIILAFMGTRLILERRK
jgi:ABC-2 type transport system permease protein